MSKLIVNIRFWYWHLQIGKERPFIYWGKNYYYDNYGLKGEKKIEVHKFFNLKK